MVADGGPRQGLTVTWAVNARAAHGPQSSVPDWTRACPLDSACISVRWTLPPPLNAVVAVQITRKMGLDELGAESGG
jgi:hypothetical protein